MGLAGSSDSGLLGWGILAVDADQSVMGLVEVGEWRVCILVDKNTEQM